MPSVIMMTNYFCLERQNSSYCGGKEIKDGVFSAREKEGCFPALRQWMRSWIWLSYTLGTLSQDPHRIILFVASLLLWGEGSTLPETTTELALKCAWTLKITHRQTPERLRAKPT